MTVVCFGILVADIFLPPLPAMPQEGELVATGDFLVQTGGCAANTAVDLARLRVPSAVVGRVGDDVFGTFVEDDLRAAGVDVTGISRTPGRGTAKTVVISVTGQDRRYVHGVGANAALRVEDLARVRMTAGDVLYVGGYLVLAGLDQDALAAQFRAARAAGVRTVLDVVVPSGEGARFEQIERLLPYVDLFLPNEDEARALTGEAEPSRQLDRFTEAGAATAVVTRGREGALLAVGGRQIGLPAPPVAAVDGSGAGDAFAAGFICGLVEGWPVERCFAFASALGASACTALGCRAGVFDRAQAEAFLAVPAAAPRPAGLSST